MSWLRLLLAGLVALAAGSGLRAADGQKGIVDELLDTFRKNILKETTPEQSAEPTEESTAVAADSLTEQEHNHTSSSQPRSLRSARSNRSSSSGSESPNARGARGAGRLSRPGPAALLARQVKNGLLDEALRLHRIFHGRLVTLSEGLERKDHQLARESQSKQDAWRQAAKQTEDCQHWRQMAESLEEENSALRDELVESRENYQRLQHFVEGFELQSAARTVGPRSRTISQLPEEARAPEIPVRRAASEELSKSCPVITRSPPQEAANLSFFWSPLEAWAQVGSSASDRLCGVSLERYRVEVVPQRLDPVDEAKIEDPKEDTKSLESNSKEVPTRELLRTPRGTLPEHVPLAAANPAPTNAAPLHGGASPVRDARTSINLALPIPSAGPGPPSGPQPVRYLQNLQPPKPDPTFYSKSPSPVQQRWHTQVSAPISLPLQPTRTKR
ncbi:unnamed protein product [Durusdinium trenchii]|uniref:Uncharacterized protein n=1 Tax=Durusdinium trenchii TaxID=1381693 RepID=A0ABP0QRJ2_9DINO